MGIPKFYGEWVRAQKYFDVIRYQVPDYVSSLLLDMNGIIHQTAQKVYGYDKGFSPERAAVVAKTKRDDLKTEHFKAITTKLMEIITAVTPRQYLVIAIDGVAPLAKIQQQRQRRYSASYEIPKQEPRTSRPQLRESRVRAQIPDKPKKVPFSSAAITPGTEYMMELDAYFQKWLTENQFALPPKVIYSSHLVPGEGEHKIIDLMRAEMVKGRGAHILYGLDADLIMLSLIAPLNEIFLMREDIRDIVNIDALKAGISRDLGNIPTALNDFVLMLYLRGNDFLPQLPAASQMKQSINKMFEVYRELNKSLTQIDDKLGEINWLNFRDFLTLLGTHETSLLASAAAQPVRYPSRMLEAAITRIYEVGPPPKTYERFNPEIFRIVWYSNSLGPRGDTTFITILNNGQTPFQVTPKRIIDMALDYLNGLAWVYSYYVNGLAYANINYHYHYSHGLLIEDIVGVLASGPILDRYQLRPEEIPFGPLDQLVAVIPPPVKKLLPKEARHLMEWGSPIYDMFPASFIIELDGKNHDYEGVVILPAVEGERIRTAVESLRIPIARRQLYAPTTNLIFTNEDALQKAIEEQLTILAEKGRQVRQTFRGRGRGRGRGEPSRVVTSRGGHSYSVGPPLGRGVSRGRGILPSLEETRERPPIRGRGFYPPRGGRGFSRGRGEMSRQGWQGKAPLM